MAADDDAAMTNGLSVLLELASEQRPLSRTALERRCGLSAAKLGKSLQVLGKAGLIGRTAGPRGRYQLAAPADEIDLSKINPASEGEKGEPGSAAGVLARMIRSDSSAGGVTLGGLAAAVREAEADVCPYFEACAALDAPEGTMFRRACECSLL
jgi:hypothetical protein